jgi:hypothetical protein
MAGGAIDLGLVKYINLTENLIRNEMKPKKLRSALPNGYFTIRT